jgi:hypothetical protein
MKNVFAFYTIMPLWYMVYLISCIYDMTPLTHTHTHTHIHIGGRGGGCDGGRGAADRPPCGGPAGHQPVR